MSPETPAAPATVPQRLRAGTGRLWKPVAQRKFSWGSIALGAAVAPVALWPLASAVWSLLGLTGLQALQVAAAVVSAILLAAGVVGLNRDRTQPLRLVWLILAAWLVAATAVAALTAFAWWLLGTPTWTPPDTLTPADLDAIATRAFAVIAGLGGVALLVISYRRQRTTESTDQREQTRLFTERFDIASEKLGSEQAAVRLASVHALAHLADDAPADRDDLVQMVIDVLCAYLRMPYEPAPDLLPEEATEEQSASWQARWQTFAAFREVRHTVIRVIGERLRKPTRWRGKNYDFTGVVFDGGDFARAEFASGTVSFRKCQFSGGVVEFSKTKFRGSSVDFSGSEFAEGKVGFAKAEFTGGDVAFFSAKFTGGLVDFSGAKFAGGSVDFSVAKFSRGRVDFIMADFIGAIVGFSGARFAGSSVDFSVAKFAGSHVNFSEAEFSGGRVDFNDTEFTGGYIHFSEVPDDAIHDLNKLGRGELRPHGLLKAVANGKPGVVNLRDSWI